MLLAEHVSAVRRPRLVILGLRRSQNRQMHAAAVADEDGLLADGVAQTAVARAAIDGVLVVQAAADGVLLSEVIAHAGGV